MIGSTEVGYVIEEIDTLVCDLLEEGVDETAIDLALEEYLAITKDLRNAGDF